MQAATLLVATLVAGPGVSLAAEKPAGSEIDTARLVAIGGSITEIVYALGAGDRLVARDTTSTYPAVATKLPDIGYMRQLSPESVLSVDPTAVLAQEGSGPPEAMDVLKKAAVPLIVVPEKYSEDGILEKIRIVGEALGRLDAAEKLARTVREEIDAAEKRLTKIKTQKRVLFILSAQGSKLLASGTGTAADGIIRLAGAQNAIEDFEGYKQLSDEAVIGARPDAILMMTGGAPGGLGDEEILSQPGIAATPAGASKTLIRMDGLYLLGFGPRTASAVRELSSKLYPTLSD
ncbi:heme/hemin ABC transporter substrate-binding protein [Mesorhizobium koreense]|jgi:iron complex transport system substrate-binding protein|uniref:heme/hemin ABC transporter substrate-binding protein n=1 Tax=Mesorhizobium koreense TaxID=3074855 RepID=UPI0035302506